MDLGLSGRVAIVTGASRGIGNACAAELVAEARTWSWSAGMRWATQPPALPSSRMPGVASSGRRLTSTILLRCRLCLTHHEELVASTFWSIAAA